MLPHFRDQRMQAGYYPAVYFCFSLPILRVSGGIKTVDIGVGGIEGIHILQSAHKFAEDLAHTINVKTGGHPRWAHFQKVPTDGIRAIVIHQIDGIFAIAAGLAHFLAFFVQNEVVYQTALV